MGPLRELSSSPGYHGEVSCLPVPVLTTILCLFGSERIRSSFLSGRDDDYLVDSSLEKFALEDIVFMKCFLRSTA